MIVCFASDGYRCMNSLDRIRWYQRNPIYNLISIYYHLKTRVGHTTQQTYILIYKSFSSYLRIYTAYQEGIMLHNTTEREVIYSKPVTSMYDNIEVLIRSNKSHIVLTPFQQTRGKRFTLRMPMEEYLAHAPGTSLPL